METLDLQGALSCVRDARYRRDVDALMRMAQTLPDPHKALALDLGPGFAPIQRGPSGVAEIAVHGRWAAVRYKKHPSVDLFDLDRGALIRTLTPPTPPAWLSFGPQGGHLYIGGLRLRQSGWFSHPVAADAIYQYSCHRGRFQQVCAPDTSDKDLINALKRARLSHPRFDATSPLVLKTNLLTTSGCLEAWAPTIKNLRDHREPWALRAGQRLGVSRRYDVTSILRLTLTRRWGRRSSHLRSQHTPVMALMACSDGSMSLVRAPSMSRVKRWTGHAKGTSAMAVDERTGRLFSAGGDGCVRVWSFRSDRCLRTFEGHKGAVTCLLRPPNEDALVSAGKDGTVRRWSLGLSGECRFVGHHDAPVTAMAMTRHRQVIAGDSSGAVHLWSLDLSPMRASL